ncbi:YPDG domain-containing protein, partial [Corynebacterium sp. HMSC067D03]|uniref:YPDG domain-containing protein n=1 Tax=Corynebacterium sp. HMSC067D03 TaxID=1739289 RepID=UPI001AEF8CE8
ATVDAPTFKKADENGDPTNETTEKPEGTGFVLSDDPEKAPTYTDKDGNEKPLPEGSVTFGPDGDFTVKIPEDAKPGSEFTVPVKVTYQDGSEETVDVTINVDKDDNEKFEPNYGDGKGKPGEDAKVEKPTFTDENGNPVDMPEGTNFDLNDDPENAPKYTDKDGNEKPLPTDKVTVDLNTGEITVPVPEDAKPGSEFTVPVKVTYPDGTTDTVDVTVKVGTIAEDLEPEYKGESGEPGEDVKVP